MAPQVERLQTDLEVAMKARDTGRVTVLRCALAAIANAEAPPIDSAPLFAQPGTTERARLELRAVDIDAIIRREITERYESIADYEGAGAQRPADDLRAEIAILQEYLG